MINQAQFEQIDTLVSKFAANHVTLGSYSKVKASETAIGKFLRHFRHVGISTFPRLTRSRTFHYLIALTFHLNLRKGNLSTFAVETYENLKIVFVVKVLLMIGARSIAIKIAMKGLAVAKRLELTENAVTLLIELRRNAALNGNKRQHASLTKELRFYSKLLLAEQEAQHYVEQLTINFSRSFSPKPHVAAKGHKFSDIIEERLKIVHSGELTLSYFRIKALAHQIEHSFSDASISCSKALEYIRSNRTRINPLREGEFVLKQLVCAMMAGQHLEALEFVRKAEIFFEKSLANWILLKEYHLLTLLQLERWDAAQDVLQSTLQSPRFLTAQPTVIERWEVYSLFLQFMLNPFAPNKRLLRLLNNQVFTRVAPSFSRDKAGLYFSLLLLKILLILSMGKFAEAMDPIDALVSYRKRYLTGKGNEAATKLAIILKNIADSNFTQKHLNTATKSLIAEVSEGTIGPNVFSGVQIVPYPSIIKVILKAVP